MIRGVHVKFAASLVQFSSRRIVERNWKLERTKKAKRMHYFAHFVMQRY
jgi:hypothetical protein